jgi:hypothetical protein
MDMFNVPICSCERCIRSELRDNCSVSFFWRCIYQKFMAIIWELLFCNSWTATLLTPVKNDWSYQISHTFRNFIRLLLINDEFHSNILFIYVRTSLLLIISRWETKRTALYISITIGIREQLIIRKALKLISSNCMHISISILMYLFSRSY